jgi:hypothetical protein
MILDFIALKEYVVFEEALNFCTENDFTRRVLI